jgi:hypothetical protein
LVTSHYYRFTLAGAAPNRSPLLEKLLARADSSQVIGDWRADAFRSIAVDAARMPGVAATALRAEGIAARGCSVYLATPVHYAAEMTSVRLAEHGVLALQPIEADALATDFNRIWHDAGVRLLAGRTSLYCVFEQGLDAATHDPQGFLGQPIESFFPKGSDASRLRRLMSEIEMWMFEHPVNLSRGSAAAISGLWLWGGGGLIEALPSVNGWTAGHDVFFRSIGAAAARHAAASGVAVIDAQPGSPAWHDAERQWLTQSAADWRAGRLQRLELCAGERRVSVGPAGRWRVWRRRCPWWEHFV